jgi:hypothetical protein
LDRIHIGPFVSIALAVVASLLFELTRSFAPQLKVQYFLRKYKPDFFTGIVAVIGYAIAYMMSQQVGLSFTLRTIVTFIAMFIIIYSKTSDKDFYFLPLQNRKEKEDWIGEGTFEYDRLRNAHIITKSFHGFIFSKCLT